MREFGYLEPYLKRKKESNMIQLNRYIERNRYSLRQLGTQAPHRKRPGSRGLSIIQLRMSRPTLIFFLGNMKGKNAFFCTACEPLQLSSNRNNQNFCEVDVCDEKSNGEGEICVEQTGSVQDLYNDSPWCLISPNFTAMLPQSMSIFQ